MARKIYSSLLLTLLGCVFCYAQYPGHTLPQYPEAWNTQWITHPGIDQTAYSLIHFRNAFSLETPPEQFVVHVSGDNRYRLYVNGQEASYGPQLGDVRHWRYETLDLAPYLQEGENIVAAEVMNWGVERSYGIVSFRTGFLLQGHTPETAVLNTGYDSQWKVLKNEGVFEKTVYWRTGGEIVGGFYAGNPMDSIEAAHYPWGWKTLDYTDDHWQSPEVIFAQPKLNAGHGHGWILQPRTTARQKNRKEPFTRIARSNLPGADESYQFGQTPLRIPAHTKARILIDQGDVTLGYPKLRMSGGDSARIQVKYAEALYGAGNRKGHRNQIEGKAIKGVSDVYVMDGGQQRVFQPIWFRTFRFIQLDIETQSEPLDIEDFYNIYSAADFPVRASFQTDNPLYEKIWGLCWRSMEICAQGNLMSDAYYEQMQYVGDLRPHLKGWTALTGDLSYFKSAMEQFNNSRLPDGNITSCYPLKATFVHPTYSLIWIDMLYDLMMLEGAPSSIEPYLGEIEEVFEYYESLINDTGLVGKSGYHMFVDWYVPKGGNSKVNRDGNSAILTLNYAYSLKNAAAIFEWLGYREKAARYQSQSRKYAEIVRKNCYDEKRGLYADDPGHTFYDQRASILAVLCDAHTEAEARQIMERALDSHTVFDSRANLFYYFYLFEAMRKTGAGNFTAQLQPWAKMLELGMSGTPEKRVEQHPRSEIHPWTAHPVHYYFNVVAGIAPAAPGFTAVDIAPNLGGLQKVTATYPTVQGRITLDCRLDIAGQLTGQVVLPATTQGTFVWKGGTTLLEPGVNTLDFQNQNTKYPDGR